MLQPILVMISLIMAVTMPIPLLKRIKDREHSRDMSKLSAWLLVLIQANQGIIAYVQHSHFFVYWYIFQFIVCGIQLGFIYKYWNYEEPRYRDEQ
jgi:hypothetical protein